MIGKITPSSEMTEKYTLVFKCVAGKPGEQEITKFRGAAEDILESSVSGKAYEKACET